jgi:hypothetical protein
MRKTLIGLAAVSALLLPAAGRAQQAAQPNSSQNATPPPAPQQSLADAARIAKEKKAAQSGQTAAATPTTPRVFDNDNIPKNGGISAVGEEPPAASGDASKSGDQAAAAGSGAPAALSGKDEKGWRDRFKTLHHQLDQDQEDLDLSQRELGVDDVQFYTDPVKGMQQGLTRSDINDKTAKIDALKKKVEADKQAIASAEDELRAAGGDIGWSR